MGQLNTRLLLRSDTTANWSREVLVEGSSTDYQPIGAHAVLGQGELGIEFLTDGTSKIKIGDGVTIWKNLDYFGGEIPEVVDTNVFEVEPNEGETHEAAIARVVGNAILAKGDIAYVKELIVNGQYSYTGYVYNGVAWAAMDGNYDASNVYFKDDMTFTTNIGTAVLGNGETSGKFETKGKSLEQVLKSLLAVVKDPTISNPTFTLSTGTITTDSGTNELGSAVTKYKWNGTYTDGKYEFGRDNNGTRESSTDAGCTAAYSISCTKAGSASGNTEDGTWTLTDPIIIDSTSSKNYGTITVDCEYSNAAYKPVNNIGEVVDGQISGSSISKNTSVNVTGYRSFFYGAVSKGIEELTSEDIRGLANGGNYNGGKSITIKANGTSGLKAFVVAIVNDNTRSGITHVDSTAGMTVDMTSSYNIYKKDNSVFTVDVADYRGGEVTKSDDGAYTSSNNPAKYKIWAWSPAEIDSGAVHVITLG